MLLYHVTCTCVQKLVPIIMIILVPPAQDDRIGALVLSAVNSRHVGTVHARLAHLQQTITS